MSSRKGTVFAGFVVGLALTACRAKAPTAVSSKFAVEFRVTNDDTLALAGATIAQGKLRLGTTGADGKLSTQIAGSEGTSLPVTVACPDGYTGPAKPTVLRLAHTRSMNLSKVQPVRVEFACARTVREVVLVVRAQGGNGLALQVDGRQSGVTDADGIAHVLVNVDRTVRQLTVSLDTSANQYLRPKNPSRVFELTGTDAILTFDQTFAQAPKPAARGTRPNPTKHVPYRID